ncbi:hypothetical protein K1T35_12005 [Pseudonocardia sp. DSM 110487]|uniref:NACHT domain-containing protein n=1 Tax=Pseudonocardia sp. DSM 110487 TaxID=2865833 RepID=UPI001C6A3379|nr:hypothetical protein [Pseudonocardia sp. DSM 110487]QYN37896.1 hypothetical protein K1T35_12005 [Pseudonocardia sp. DSM 110487]
MPRYELNRLGAAEFENLIQALLKEVVGDGTITFGAGADGGREATFSGTASYPSDSTRWSGNWVFQVKFHDIELQGIDKCRKSLINDIEEELDKTFNKYNRDVQNYIFATNVALSGVHESGTHDVISKLFRKFDSEGRNFHIWGADDINRLLEKYRSVRTSYLHLVVAGDLISALLDQQQREYDATATTIESYLRSTFTREQYAQLDQAGDMSEEPVKLQQVFFELHAKPTLRAYNDRVDLSKSSELVLAYARKASGMQAASRQARVPVVQMFLDLPGIRTVLVGGPGEGKSTAGQYLAQLHRAQLLGDAARVAISEEYEPAFPRLPFRVILREFGQWVSEQHSAHHGSTTLEEYICYEILKATSRRITPDVLHDVMKQNPAILILDGLDEITDPVLKKDVTDRAEEFIDRAERVLKADLQVLATTRPNGYNDHFNPESYVHLELSDVQPPQIRSFVHRYATARKLDDARTARLKRGIEDCLSDRQVKLLMNTPLQVTILVLIVVSGGTPPRQREGLFNQYLEVIYKREQNKGIDILTTSKELLVDLHKYIGYELQERATRASATDATLSEADYTQLVEEFLDWNDPFSSELKRAARLKSITVEAGERLVLIVEPYSGRFGFELRSLQEFFAACHLVDTSRNTDQRYRRFEAIARLPHWQNVALFFAGRVGRNFQGEAAAIIEVCRRIDRTVPDVHIRRGAQLALNIAFDRAFLPDRWLQHSVIEFALEMLDAPLSEERLEKIRDVISEMPDEDISDHIIPILERRVQTLAPERLYNSVLVLSTLDQTNAELVPAFRRMMSADLDLCKAAAAPLLRTALSQSEAKDLIPDLISQLTVEQLCDEIVRMGRGDFREIASIIKLVLRLDVPNTVHLDLLSALASTYYPDRAMTGRGLRAIWPRDWVETGPELLLRTAHSVVALISSFDSGRRRFSDSEKGDVLDLMRERLHPAILRGTSHEFAKIAGLASISHPLLGPFWMLHLLLGNCTTETITRALAYFKEGRTSSVEAVPYMLRFRNGLTPVPDYVASRLENNDDVESIMHSVSRWCGFSGTRQWADFANHVRRSVEEGVMRSRRAQRGARHNDESIRGSYNWARRHAELAERAGDIDLLFYALDGYPPGAIELFESHNEFVGALFATPYATEAKRNLIKFWAARWTDDTGVDLEKDVLKRLIESDLHRTDSNLIRAILVVLLGRPAARETGLVEDGLRLIGQESPRFQYAPLASGSRSTTAIFRQLLNYGRSSADENVRRGALRLVRAICFPFAFERSLKPPRFSGLAEIHRELCKSDDPECRMAGIAMFSIRKNWGSPDLEILRLLFVRCESHLEEDLLVRLMEIDGLGEERRHGLWAAVLTDLLPLRLFGDLSARVRDALVRVLEGSDQSLASAARELSLPLARRGFPQGPTGP